MATTTLKYLNQYITTTLSVVGGIDASQTTSIVIQSSTGLETTKAGVALLSYTDPLNTTNAEWITYTAITANEFQGVTRGAEGGTGKVHANGVTIAFPLSESHINDLNDLLTGVTDGAILSKPSIKNSVTEYTPAGAGTTTITAPYGIHTVTMPAATQTLAVSNEVVGQCFIVEINNVTSQGALTWFSTIRWAGGSAPTLTGTNGKRDTFGFRVTGTDTYDGFIVGQNI